MVGSSSSEHSEQLPKGPLDLCKIGVIGVTVRDEEKRLIRIIHELGGIYTSDVKADTFCVLVKKVGPQHKAITTHKIPAVELQWLSDCRRSLRNLSFDKYLVKPLIGLVICCTGYTNEERNLIEKCTTENGGEFSSKMNRETCTHLITEEEDPSTTSKYAYAKVWRTVQIVTMKWLTDCKKQKSKREDLNAILTDLTPIMIMYHHYFFTFLHFSQAWINEYEYLVSTAAADEAQKAAELKKQQKESTDKKKEDMKADLIKKRKSTQISQVLTVADLPSFEQLNHRKCRNVFIAETFFVSGFSLEVRDYVIKLILFGGGKRHHILSAAVTKIMLGSYSDERLVAASRQHPLGAESVTLSWLIQSIFSV